MRLTLILVVLALIGLSVANDSKQESKAKELEQKEDNQKPQEQKEAEDAEDNDEDDSGDDESQTEGKQGPMKVVPMEPMVNQQKPFNRKCFCCFPKGHPGRVQMTGPCGPFLMNGYVPGPMGVPIMGFPMGMPPMPMFYPQCPGGGCGPHVMGPKGAYPQCPGGCPGPKLMRNRGGKQGDVPKAKKPKADVKMPEMHNIPANVLPKLEAKKGSN